MKILTALALTCVLFLAIGCECNSCNKADDSVAAGAMGAEPACASSCGGDCGDRTEPCEKGDQCCVVTGKCSGSCDSKKAAAPACASSCDKAATCDKAKAAGCSSSCGSK